MASVCLSYVLQVMNWDLMETASPLVLPTKSTPNQIPSVFVQLTTTRSTASAPNVSQEPGTTR